MAVAPVCLESVQLEELSLTMCVSNYLIATFIMVDYRFKDHLRYHFNDNPHMYIFINTAVL